MLTNLPLRSTIHKLDLSGRMVWCAIKVSEFGIQYKPCLALKGQVLEDVLVELPQPDMDRGNIGWWILNVDEASRQMGVGVGLQLKAPTGKKIEHGIWLYFPASNNEIEYKAILARVDLTKSVSSKNSSYAVTLIW